ncbi:hypothetical protein MIR68_007174 [Amoeboaphelidium protococcarum]|nr:hypothetical protein MIR68_007174 [Amoeboaphelidium protococcarum]KAI3645182.1 hypothetical protein MP228_011346 [Amoeboaphelidium protococcarum]KAI3652596.1 hypothetical protein MP228_002021 [Amoeboaphelidium protococcarum]
MPTLMNVKTSVYENSSAGRKSLLQFMDKSDINLVSRKQWKLYQKHVLQPHQKKTQVHNQSVFYQMEAMQRYIPTSSHLASRQNFKRMSSNSTHKVGKKSRVRRQRIRRVRYATRSQVKKLRRVFNNGFGKHRGSNRLFSINEQ